MGVNSAILDRAEPRDRLADIEPIRLPLGEALAFEALGPCSDTAEQTGGGDGKFEPAQHDDGEGHNLIDLELAEQPRQTREDQQGEDDDGDEVEVAHRPARGLMESLGRVMVGFPVGRGPVS